jgi:hypothetical protein
VSEGNTTDWREGNWKEGILLACCMLESDVRPESDLTDFRLEKTLGGRCCGTLYSPGFITNKAAGGFYF